VAPSGGPRDTTPPSIVATQPARDSVNVSTSIQSVSIEFSEYIERTSLTQALTVTPPVDGRLRYDWDGRSVDIELPTALRDSTTYILTLDGDLRDARGVSLNDPLTVAFSTGPRIDQGELKGRVVAPQRAQPQARVDIYAYRPPSDSAAAPTPLPERPAYRTQTGKDGTFALDYLREGRYYVLALRDNNRNRRPDPGERVAVPPRPALVADSGRAPVPVPWLLTAVDTLAPTLQRAQAESRQRIRLRFSEPIRRASPTPNDWALRDSTADAPVPVRAVYRPADRANTVVLRTDAMAPTRHVLPLRAGLVTDTLGQPLVPDTARFTAVDRPDTTQTRFRAFLPRGGTADSAGIHFLLPDVRPGVAFNQAPDSSTLRAVLSVQDTTGTARPYRLSSDDGRTYRVRLQPPLGPDMPVDLRVDGRALTGRDTTYQRRVQRISASRLGALEGRAVVADTAHPAVPTTARDARENGRPDSVVVELQPAGANSRVEPRRQVVAPGSTFVFRKLPEGRFRFRAFVDRNGNGRWDGGTLRPFRRAEPITWSEQAAELRPRWTSVLPAALRIPILTAPPASVPASEGPAASPAAADTTATDTARARPGGPE
jgi:uncharacterized protein (DUF2141 family)